MSKLSDDWSERSERNWSSPPTSNTAVSSPNEARQYARDVLRASVLEHLKDATRSRQPFGRIVDLGCGRGRWIESYIEWTECAVGVDSDPDLIADACRRTAALRRIEDIEYHVADIGEYDDFADAGLVTFEGCLEGLDDTSLGALVERVEDAQQQDDVVHIRERATRPDADDNPLSSSGRPTPRRARSDYRQLFERRGYECVYEKSDATIITTRGLETFLPFDVDRLGVALTPLMEQIVSQYPILSSPYVNWLFRRT